MNVGLVAVQVAMELEDYTEARFGALVDGCARDAAAALGEVDGALLVFPEHLGFLLPVVSRNFEAARASNSFRELVENLAGTDPVDQRRLWCEHAPETLEFYESTFSAIARLHGVHVVAGSITTPIIDRSPHLAGQMVLSEGTLFNVSPLFGPTGRCLSHTAKVRIPPGEDQLISAAAIADLVPTATAIGSVGTALCFDGYHERPLERLDAGGAEIVAQPTHFPGPEIRYDGTGAMIPAHEDFGRLIQGRENIRVGVSAALVGQPFPDRRAEGKSHIVSNRGQTDATWEHVPVAEATDTMTSTVVAATVEL